MTTVDLNAVTKIALYSSIKELPIGLEKKLHGYLLQDAGIGNTISDVDARLQRLMAFAQAGKTEEVREEVANFRFTLFSALHKISYKHLSFGCLIHSVNGERVEDHTEEGLQELLDRLSGLGLTAGKVEAFLDEVKKKLIPSGFFTSLPSSEMT